MMIWTFHLGGFVLNIEEGMYVLETFDRIEQSQLDQILSRAAESLNVMLLEGLEKAMNQFQKKDRTEG
jgi:peptidyl-tRNA hydrolase